MKSLIDKFKPKLRQNRVYILPNRQGYFFLLTSFVLFNMGNIYGNNVVLLLSFLMISFAVINMILTHLNIKNIEVFELDLKSQFAKTPSSVTLNIENKNNRNVDDLSIHLVCSEKILMGELKQIFAKKNGKENLVCTFDKRGKLAAKRIQIQTQSPSQLFYAWKYFDIDKEYYIYPAKLERNHHYLANEWNEQRDNSFRDHFFEHQAYQPHLPSKSIDWKVYGRTDQLLWKKFSGEEQNIIELDYKLLKGEKEQRLQILSFLIDQYNLKNRKWSLNIGEYYFAGASGSVHYKKCMEVLACF